MKKMKAILAVVLVVVLAIPFTGNISFVSAKKKYAKTIKVSLKDGQDATTEIQKALDEAEKAGTKKKQALVKIPAGTYYISKTLNIGSNTFLSLDKKTIIKKNPKPKDPVLYMLRSKQGTKGGYDDTTKITVSGGKWDAEFIKYKENTGGTIFFFAHTNNLKIQDVTVCNNFGTHLIEMGGVKKCTIKNCRLYGFKAPASDTEKEAIQIDICHSDSIFPAGGPFDDTPCEDITVTGCEISDYPRAIGSHMMVEGLYHKKITITNNKLHDIDKAAIYGYNYTDVVTRNNTITNVGCAIQIKSDSEATKTKLTRNSGVKAMSLSNDRFNIDISDNTISLRKAEGDDEANKGGSIGIFIYGSDIYPMSGITINNNPITSNSSGIYLRYVHNAVITDNTIDRHTGAKAVETTGFSEDAIKLLACRNAEITNNKISTINSVMFENGIAMRDSSKNAVLTGNTIKGVSDHGISLLSGSSAVIKNCEITGSGKRGINVKENCEVEIRGCTVSGCKGNAIYIGEKDGGLSTKATVADCQILNNDAEGIHLVNATVNITGNTIRYNCLKETDGKAVAVFSSVTGSITNNTLYNPNAKSEIKVFDGASLNPYVPTAKVGKVSGTMDAAGNRFE